MDPTWLAAIIIGILAPFAQEILTRGRITGRAAVVVSTLVTPFIGGLIALWLTGGLVGMVLPGASLLDPSPLLNFFGHLWDKVATIAMLSRLTYTIPGVGATSATVAVGPKGGLSVESPGTPGLVQKVAGTGTGTAPATTPTA